MKFIVPFWICCCLLHGEDNPFIVIHSSPIFQDITRAAFFIPNTKGDSGQIHFSTLESFHVNKDIDRFLWVTHDMGARSTVGFPVEGSTEGRSFYYSSDLKGFVIGASLGPQLFLFDAVSNEISRLWRGPQVPAWIHQFTVIGDKAYLILSSALPSINGFEGVLEINLRNGTMRRVTPTWKAGQTYGGVETVDPVGRIWFYRGYPFVRQWCIPGGGIQTREVQGMESWQVESWDLWKGHAYFLFSQKSGRLTKLPVDLGSLKLKTLTKGGEDDDVFRKCVRVDMYGAMPVENGCLYFNPGDSSFFLRPAGADFLHRLGKMDLGRFDLVGFNNFPQESSCRWIHPRWGEIRVLGWVDGKGLLLWIQGRKKYAVAPFNSGDWKWNEIAVRNLSPSTITSLCVDSDGNVFGGGYLTFSHIFKIGKGLDEPTLLKEAIPFGEGQINSLIKGGDGNLYGAAYPDSVLFNYNPRLPWAPGSSPGSNPINLGPLGHHRQMRAYKGIQDLDGNLWYESRSDFESPVTHALARANFSNMTLTVRTDTDDNFPVVSDLAVFDSRHLVLLGHKKKSGGEMFLLDQRDFSLSQEKSIKESPGSLLRFFTGKELGPLFLSQGNQIYKISSTLDLILIGELPGPVLKMVQGNNELLVIGQSFIIGVPLERGGEFNVYWKSNGGAKLFKDPTWAPVVYRPGELLFADHEKLISIRVR